MDYKDTLNLPKTEFPMRASLAKQEPVRLAKWEKADLYHKVLEQRDKGNKYILHDGPPYANGHIHLGTALNKIIKDIIVKVKLAQGFYSPYIPGWDCHGLPIEHKVDTELGDKKANFTTNEIRKMCREYANKWLDIQREEFKRLGVIGDWDDPYITMKHDYEAITLEEFYKVYKSGAVYKGSKPVYWCIDCVTALAEAEVEYANHTSHSIHVKFALTDATLKTIGMNEAVSAIIWTTTPWTLPANMAISAHPTELYSVMKIKTLADDSIGNLKVGENVLVAKALTDDNASLKGILSIAEWEEVKVIESSELDRATAHHPFFDKESMFVLGDHVLMSDGTGLVHTAPAHGMDDYIVGIKYDIEVFNPVDDYGKYRKDLPIFGGEHIYKGNEKIVALLKENGSLVALSKIVHSYPHCWRCKKPVIHRATPQWFISMDSNGLREKALNAIRNEVTWIPKWGENRIGSMVETRPDWCISRQRSWGVPIALFMCRSCDEVIFNEEIEKKVIDSFKDKGADAWFEYGVEHYLGKDAKCPHCGETDIKQETDILDVWFDSGTSHAAVCEVRPEIGGRANMYLEGSDQHRGWFHSSLLESVATRGVAPYTEVLTHGFIMDDSKSKMSKSVGNVIAPKELIEKYGAEIIRLWVASEDYTGDISISQQIIQHQADVYRKIRNTLRFLLGNLYDFNYDTDRVEFEEMNELDRYILLRWQDVMNRIYDGFDKYQFHVFYHVFINFCTNDLSALYLDVIKDRIYSNAPNSKLRRSAQTVLHILARDMAVVMSPVLSFTADEVWEYLSSWSGKKEFVFEELFPKADIYKDDAVMEKMDKLLQVRRAVNKALELSRADKVIGHPLDANVVIGLQKGFATMDEISIDEGLTRFFIVSGVEIKPFNEVDGHADDDGNIVVSVTSSGAHKCSRCWTKDKSVASEGGICDRCTKVLEEIS